MLARRGRLRRFRVADDVVHQLQEHGDPWRLKSDLPPPSLDTLSSRDDDVWQL
jgi:hypothetical protein